MSPLQLVTAQIVAHSSRESKLRMLRDRECRLATAAFDAGYDRAGIHHMGRWNYYDQQLAQLLQAGVA